MGPFLRSQEAWGRMVLDAQRNRAAPNTRVQVAKENIIFHRDRILCNCHGYGKLVIHIPIRNLGLRQGIDPFCQLAEMHQTVFADGHAEIDIRICRVNIQRFFDFVPFLSKTESVYIVCE